MKEPRTLNSRWRVHTTRAAGECSLRYATYSKSGHEPTNYIVYMNGRTEWIEKNKDLPDCLNLPDDCGFLTWDHRGQGASGGDRSYINSYDTYVDDAAQIIEEATEGKPYAILAHSMGGLIAIYGTLKKRLRPTSIVASAPLLCLPNHPIPRVFARPIATTLSAVGLAKQRTGAGSYDRDKFAENRLTHSFDMFEVICSSPYRIPSATFGWIKASFRAVDEVFRADKLANLNCPVLVLSPGEECIVDPVGHSRWVSDAQKHSDQETRCDLIHGARHELFSEIDKFRDQAIGKVNNWFWKTQ